MRIITTILLMGTPIISPFCLAMQQVRTFKAGPLHLINKNDYPLEIEIRLAKNFGNPGKRQALQPNQSITIPSLRAIINTQESERAAQMHDEGAYEILIYLPTQLGHKEALKFPITQALDKI